MAVAVSFSLLLALTGASPSHARTTPATQDVSTVTKKPDLSWHIKKDHWSGEDNRNFEKFIFFMGDSGCRTVDQCLKSPANPWRDTDPAGMKYYSDCGDFPYVLRAYFAWKNNLPFSVAAAIYCEGHSRPCNIQYNAHGNRIYKRFDITAKSADQPPNGIQTLNRISWLVTSALYRINPLSCFNHDENRFSDHYPVAISRESVKPGTVVYDPNGHVAIVYKIEKDGRILFMDAHPDNSVTRGTFGRKFAMSRHEMGPGFKNWRPLKLTGYTRSSDGTLIGGRITGTLEGKLPDFSTEQYFGNQDGTAQKLRPDLICRSPEKQKEAQLLVRETKKQKSIAKEHETTMFSSGGETLDYYDYVRSKMALGDLKFHPVQELTNMLQGLCNDIKDRAVSVQVAIAKGIHKKKHPPRLPYNIYGTTGEWEDYSTPSRDARLKTSFKELRDQLAVFIARQRSGDAKIIYAGKDIKHDLLAAFEHEAKACTITYAKTDGQTVTLSLEDVLDRLFKLSFDPYHCIELRWGASSTDELASCRDSAVKRKWYDGEQFMRNQIDRTYNAKMNFSLKELFKHQKGNGVPEAPEADARKILR